MLSNLEFLEMATSSQEGQPNIPTSTLASEKSNNSDGAAGKKLESYDSIQNLW